MAQIVEKQAAVVQTSEAQIAVHWREEEYYYPPSKFIGQANLTDPSVTERFSEKNFPECVREYADLLSWDDTSDPPFGVTEASWRDACVENSGFRDLRVARLRRPGCCRAGSSGRR